MTYVDITSDYNETFSKSDLASYSGVVASFRSSGTRRLMFKSTLWGHVICFFSNKLFAKIEIVNKHHNNNSAMAQDHSGISLNVAT